MIDDATLLRRYAAEKSGDAFAGLVRRHLPLVYAAALRRLNGDAHDAEDVAQEVFCALARNAHTLSRHPALAGWLYTATRNEVLNLRRGEKRRRVREKEAHLMHEILLDTEKTADWSQLRPVLDDAMDRLGERDREAVLLRFFEGLPFAAIGNAIGSSEDAARKRVDRALDQLRTALRPHGIASTSAALAALLAHQTISAAPATLVASITGVALATGGTTAAATTTFLALSKLQAGIAAAVVLGTGAGLFLQQRTVSALREENSLVQQHAAKVATENAALAAAGLDRDAELARLRTELSALKSAPLVTSGAAGQSSTVAHTSSAPSLTSGGPIAAQNSSVDTPAIPAEKAKLHRRYDPFLQRRGLTPAQAERFIELRLAINQTNNDVQAAMRQTGAQGGTPGLEAMRSKLTKPMWDEMRELLGKEGFRAYNDYESVSFYQESFVRPLESSFAAASARLSPEQVEQLARIFAANNHPVRVNPTDRATTVVIDWDGVVAQAGAILTSAQLTTLQAYADRKKSAPRSR